VVVENAKLKSRDKLALGAIVILGLVFRIFLLLFSNTIPRAIGSQKIIQACLIKMDILSSVHEANPPIYLLLLKFFMYIFSDQLFVPRVISLVFGVGTIFIFFLSVKIISDCRIALLASLVLALAPLHAFWSIFSTEDAIFIFLFLQQYTFFLSIN